MKRITIFSIFIVFLAMNFNTYGQISNRVNSPSTFKTGTRPIMGDMGVSVGISAKEIMDRMDTSIVDYEGFPLVNFKYYHSDDLIFRIGMKTNKKKSKLKGELADDNFGVTQDYDIEAESIISPGIEKHFLSSNVVDVYVGVALPLGYKSSKQDYFQDFTASDYSYITSTQTSLVYGINGFFGLQAFIADLPLALGLELGFRGLAYSGLQYKHEIDASIGGVSTKETFYTKDGNVAATWYDKLSYSKSELGGDVRVTLNYYFSK